MSGSDYNPPHRPPEYANASVPHFSKHQKENHTISNPFAHSYDDGEDITPVSVKHLHTHGKTYLDEEDESLRDKISPQRRPSLDNIKFQEGLEVAHLPRTLSAHAKGPTFLAPEESAHPMGSFQPPGSKRAELSSSSSISQKHNWQRAHFEPPGAKGEEDTEEPVVQARYHHYTAPHDHAHTAPLVNEDNVEPYDPYAAAKVKSLDASAHDHDHDHDPHSSHQSVHHTNQHTLHETYVGGRRRPSAGSNSNNSNSPMGSPGKDDFHGKPLFSPQEAKRLEEKNFSHEKPVYSSGVDERSVFGFGTRDVDEPTHSRGHGIRHLVEDASGHISADNVVSGTGNAYLDDEPTVRQVRTKSKEDMWK